MQFGNPIVGLEELIRSAIRSQGYVSGVTGWRIAADGSAEFSTVVIRGAGVGDSIVVGPTGLPQVRVGSTPTNGYIQFPTNSPIAKVGSQIWAIKQNIGLVNEFATFQIDGPSVSGAGAQDRVFSQFNSQSNDGSSNANWNLRTVQNGFIMTADKDIVRIIPPTDSANYPEGGWTSYFPQWSTTTGNNLPSFGNTTLLCKWRRTGRVITLKISIAFGATANFGAAPLNTDIWKFSLPQQAAEVDSVVGFVELSQSASVRAMGRVSLVDQNWFQINISSAITNGQAIVNPSVGLISSVTPWTWQSPYAIRGMIQYEALGSF